MRENGIARIATDNTYSITIKCNVAHATKAALRASSISMAAPALDWNTA